MAKRHKLSKSSLHWFIKSRPYVLIPELRRRFEMELEDEAVAIQLQQGRAYVALPPRAARLLEDLVKEQRVGLEMAVDMMAPMVMGVYAFDLLKQVPGAPPNVGEGGVQRPQFRGPPPRRFPPQPAINANPLPD